LEPVSRSVPENEQVAGQGVAFQAVLHEGEEAVEAQTHIDGVRTIPEFDARRHGQHDRPPRASTSSRMKSGSQPGARRRTMPPGKRISTGAAPERTWTGTRRATSAGGKAGRTAGSAGRGRRGRGPGQEEGVDTPSLAQKATADRPEHSNRRKRCRQRS